MMSKSKTYFQIMRPVYIIFIILIGIGGLIFLFDYFQWMTLRIIFQDIFAFGCVFDVIYMCYRGRKYHERWDNATKIENETTDTKLLLKSKEKTES